jgi:hypothetical protein
LTLDDDVAVKLRAEVRRSGKRFKEIVNETLRIGLNSQRLAKAFPPYKVKARNLGLRPGFSYDNISELLEQLDRMEGKSYR